MRGEKMPTEKTYPDKEKEKEEREKAGHKRTVEWILSEGKHTFNVMVALSDNSVITVPNVKADTPESALFRAATIKLGLGEQRYRKGECWTRDETGKVFCFDEEPPPKSSS